MLLCAGTCVCVRARTYIIVCVCARARTIFVCACVCVRARAFPYNILRFCKSTLYFKEPIGCSPHPHPPPQVSKHGASTSTETIRLIRDGENGPGPEGGMEVWEEGDYIPIATRCHHQNDFCIKMCSDESHFNVSLIVRDKVTRPCPQTTTSEEKGEPKRYRTEPGPSAA